MPVGHPRRYQPDELWDKFKEWIETTTDFPTIISFCMYLDLPRSSYYAYQDIDEYQDTIKKIDDKLEQITINKMLDARNPAGAIFYAKNKHGYSDKLDIKAETTDKSALDKLSKEELEAELSKLGYKKK
jgi:hypothetical protein